MNVPKKKRTSRKNRQRRALQKISPLNLTRCPSCQKLIPPHNVCKFCGHYGSEVVIPIKVKEGKAATA